MNRRTVLQRGLAILAGFAGLEVVDPKGRLRAEVLEPPNSGFQRLLCHLLFSCFLIWHAQLLGQ